MNQRLVSFERESLCLCQSNYILLSILSYVVNTVTSKTFKNTVLLLMHNKMV